MRQKARVRRVTSFGALRWGVLWSGFAGGAAAALVSWIILHANVGTPAKAPATYNLQSENIVTYEPEIDDITVDESPQKNRSAKSPSQADPQEPNVSVYLSDKQTVENVPLETYVLGVVAAEMPLTFEQAALEAQAMAARTYIVRRLLSDNRDGVPDRQALVTDQVTHQAYVSLARMNALREADPEGVRKAQLAVERTRNIIITYKDEPIEALFFSASNGYTENSEEVFPNKLPYLRAVSSPWDEAGEHSTAETIEMPLKVFYEKLNVSTLPAMGTMAAKPTLRVLERTEGHRVKFLLVGSEKRTGEEVRGKLGLRSAAFDWKIDGSIIRITTHGNGHGVGMSQWGAEGMAKKGSSARQIVEHYYTGIRLTEASKLLENGNRDRPL